MALQILSVGQCAADQFRLAEWLRRRWQADCVAVDDADAARARLNVSRPDLVLINRIFDRDGGSGLEMIRRWKSDPETAKVPVMLVSDFPEAQAQAAALGALPGFGKAQLEWPQTLSRMAAFLVEGR